MIAAAATQMKLNCCMPWFQIREAAERKLVQRPASNRRINGPECCRPFLACITGASLPAQQVKLENIECFFLGAFAMHAVRERATRSANGGARACICACMNTCKLTCSLLPSSVVMRGNILRSYRELLTLLKRLPNDAQSAAGKEAKNEILAHRHETDSLKITDLHKQLIAKISFLRMTTTRRPGERSRQASGTFILREGDLVETESASEQRWD